MSLQRYTHLFLTLEMDSLNLKMLCSVHGLQIEYNIDG